MSQTSSASGFKKILSGGLIISASYIVNPLSIFFDEPAISEAQAFSDKKTTIDERIEVEYPNELGADATRFLLDQIREADATLTKLLEVDYKKYTIDVGYHKRPEVNRARYTAYIPVDFIQKKQVGPIWHELVHILTGKAGDFYSEGLAEWIRHTRSPSSKMDMHQYVNRMEFHKSHPVSKMVNLRTTDAPEGEERNAQYSVADSFVKFLIEDISKGNIKPFLAFYKDGDHEYKKHFGMTFDELAKAWNERINNYSIYGNNKVSAQTPVKIDDLKPGNSLYLHDPSIHKPLHLGDAIGQIDDLERNYREFMVNNPKQRHSWPFQVATLPNLSQIEVQVYSVTVDFPGCNTNIHLNGKFLYNLNSLPGAGDGKMLDATLTIDNKLLTLGQNNLELIQQGCGLGNRYYDDIMVKSIRIKAQ